MGQGQPGDRVDARACSCRSAGRPTTATWPAPPDRSRRSGSRRCSSGRSTTPATAISRPGRHVLPVRPRTGRRGWAAARCQRRATRPAAAARSGAPGAPRPVEPVDQDVQQALADRLVGAVRIRVAGSSSSSTAGADVSGGVVEQLQRVVRGDRQTAAVGRRCTPDTYAERNRSIGSVPTRRKPWPGARGSRKASFTPRTVRLSMSENVRSPIRYDR